MAMMCNCLGGPNCCMRRYYTGVGRIEFNPAPQLPRPIPYGTEIQPMQCQQCNGTGFQRSGGSTETTAWIGSSTCSLCRGTGVVKVLVQRDFT